MKIEFDEKTNLFSLTQLTFQQFNQICSMIMYCTEEVSKDTPKK